MLDKIYTAEALALKAEDFTKGGIFYKGTDKALKESAAIMERLVVDELARDAKEEHY